MKICVLDTCRIIKCQCLKCYTVVSYLLWGICSKNSLQKTKSSHLYFLLLYMFQGCKTSHHRFYRLFFDRLIPWYLTFSLCSKVQNLLYIIKTVLHFCEYFFFFPHSHKKTQKRNHCKKQILRTLDDSVLYNIYLWDCWTHSLIWGLGKVRWRCCQMRADSRCAWAGSRLNSCSGARVCAGHSQRRCSEEEEAWQPHGSQR